MHEKKWQSNGRQEKQNWNQQAFLQLIWRKSSLSVLILCPFPHKIYTKTEKQLENMQRTFLSFHVVFPPWSQKIELCRMYSLGCILSFFNKLHHLIEKGGVYFVFRLTTGNFHNDFLTEATIPCTAACMYQKQTEVSKLFSVWKCPTKDGWKTLRHCTGQRQPWFCLCSSTWLKKRCNKCSCSPPFYEDVFYFLTVSISCISSHPSADLALWFKRAVNYQITLGKLIPFPEASFPTSKIKAFIWKIL